MTNPSDNPLLEKLRQLDEFDRDPLDRSAWVAAELRSIRASIEDLRNDLVRRAAVESSVILLGTEVSSIYNKLRKQNHEHL